MKRTTFGTRLLKHPVYGIGFLLRKKSSKKYILRDTNYMINGIRYFKAWWIYPGSCFFNTNYILVFVAYFLYARKNGNNRSRYFENFYLSFSFFLSWLPMVNETLTRIPIGHPLAKDTSEPGDRVNHGLCCWYCLLWILFFSF